MKVFSKDIRNSPKLSIIIIFSLSFIVIIVVIGFLVWNDLNPEGQEEFEQAATIYYYTSNKCSSDCLVYGRSVNTKKKNRNFLINAIALGKIGGDSIIRGETINPSIWQCTKDGELINSATEPLLEGQHYDCFKQYNIPTE